MAKQIQKRKATVKNFCFLLFVTTLIIIAGCFATFKINEKLTRTASLKETKMEAVKLSPLNFLDDDTSTYKLYPWSYYSEEQTTAISDEELVQLTKNAYGQIFDLLKIQFPDIGETSKQKEELTATFKKYFRKYQLTEDTKTQTWYVLDALPLSDEDCLLYCMVDDNYHVTSFHTRKNVRMHNIQLVWELFEKQFHEVQGLVITEEKDKVAAAINESIETELIDNADLAADYISYLYELNSVFLQYGLISPDTYDTYISYEDTYYQEQFYLPSDSQILIEKDMLVIPYINSSNQMIYIYYDPAYPGFSGYHFQNAD